MNPIVCLDVGDKKIGIAFGNPNEKIAFPFNTLKRTTFRKDCEAVLKLVQEKRVQKIVIGLPLDLQDEEGPQAKKVRFFGEGLQKFLGEQGADIPITFWEESFSSREAEAVLLKADLSRSKRKQAIDKLAAALILQNYLEAQSDDRQII